MPDIQHNVLAGSELHEPKGIAGASSGEVYIADGVGSGAWSSADSTITHGNLYSIDTDAVSISGIGTTAKKLEGFSHDGPSSGVTPANASDQMTIGSAGNYYVNFSISFSTTATADAGTYEFRVRVDGAETVIGLRREMSGSNDTGSGSASGLLVLAANEVVTVYVESDEAGNTDDIDIDFCSLSVFKVGS